MLIPPPYLTLLDPPPARSAHRAVTAETPSVTLATMLLAAATGAVAGGLTAWFVVVAAS